MVWPRQNLGGGYRRRQPVINKNGDNNVAPRCDARARGHRPLARLTRAKLIASARWDQLMRQGHRAIMAERILMRTKVYSAIEDSDKVFACASRIRF